MSKWIALGAAVWIVGCASTGNAPLPPEGPAVAAAPVGCVSATGSRIPGECTGPGHSYSQTDIANTGETTAAGALALLDPTLTVHH